ncbi:DUF6786 family protein [Compostibacter hankyongensis]|uniref:Lipoprotein n=1 Tax=Compostibacter hankyongensis TaxID=1007089 RepID=A0ABP8FT04_9BACT
MYKKRSFIMATALLATLACNHPRQGTESNTGESFPEGTFGYDVTFLQQHDSVIVLKDGSGMAGVIVSPKYQAKVFTSTAEGPGGRSFGWVNYKAFTGPKDAHMNAYGGENRLWLGPEGGKYSLFFKPGAKMVYDNWVTPAAVDTDPWEVSEKSGQSVSMKKDMQLQNYAGATLNLSVNRKITLLDRPSAESQLSIQLGDSVKAVGYQTDNTITNTGNKAWTAETGMPCIWILDMFRPAPRTVIAVPYRHPEDHKTPVATADYFGQIPPDRLKYDNGVLFLKADGKSRGKLGVPPGRAKTVAGSYDPESNVLTIIHFDMDSTGKYLNQEWNTDKPVFSGDAVNAYNDGPLEDGSQMGPFYEMESVSPAAALDAGASLSHRHSVFHFTGDKAALNRIAEQVLGASLQRIENTFGDQ